MRVLLVEDESAVRFDMARVFKERGHSTAQASTGAKAIVALAESFDVVVLDLVIPEPNGLEVLAEINVSKRDGGTKPRVFVLSAYSPEWCVGVAGVDKFYPKPVNSTEFVLEIEKEMSCVAI